VNTTTAAVDLAKSVFQLALADKYNWSMAARRSDDTSGWTKAPGSSGASPEAAQATIPGAKRTVAARIDSKPPIKRGMRRDMAASIRHNTRVQSRR
jgi:hypothetical protein